MVTIDTYNESNCDTSYNFTATTRKVVECLTVPSTSYYLTSAKFWLKYTTGYSFTMIAELFNLDGGVVGSTAKPTGSAIEVSTSIAGSNLTTSYQLIEFSFSGNTLLKANNGYAIGIGLSAYTSGTLNVGIDGGGGHAGNLSYSNNTGSTWTNYGEDVIFYELGIATDPAGVLDANTSGVLTTNSGAIKTVM